MTFKVICRKDVVYKNNTSPLCLFFFHNGRKKSVGLGISVNQKYWDAAKQRISTECPNRDEIQFQIATKVKEYEKKIQRLEALEIPITFETLFNNNGQQFNITVGDYFEQIIERLEKVEKYGSASKHKVTLSLMRQFRSVDIHFNQIDLNYLREFEIFLRQRHNQNNSIATKFSVLKAVYNKALSENVFIAKSHPFNQFKVGSFWTTTRKRAITKEDILTLFALDLSNRDFYTQLAKDIFLFSYFMAGINFKDIALLKYCDIQNGSIYYTRGKTGKIMNCKLNEEAKKIISKYDQESTTEDYIFPILNRNIHNTERQILNRVHKVLGHINACLQQLSKELGLQIPLTTYTARHTYATVLKRSGVNIALISESLGHSDISTTQIYLDSFENSQIDEAMKNLL